MSLAGLAAVFVLAPPAGIATTSAALRTGTSLHPNQRMTVDGDRLRTAIARNRFVFGAPEVLSAPTTQNFGITASG